MADDTKPIPYWGYFAQMTPQGGAFLQEDPNGSPPAQEFLAAVRSYDPSATWEPYHPYGGTYGWRLSVDESKLPGGGWPGAEQGRAGVDLNPGAFDPMYWSPLGNTGESWSQTPKGHGMQGQAKDPSKVQNSSVWGNYTTQSNWETPDSNLFGILGPLGVLGFAFGAPFLASAMSGGALGTGAGAGLLSTGGDSYLGLGAGFPEFQGVPAGAGLLDTGSDAYLGLGPGFSGEFQSASIPPLDTGGDAYLGLGGGGTAQAPIPSLDTGSDFYLGLEPGASFQGVTPPSLLDRARAFANSLGLGDVSKLPLSGLLGGTPSGALGGSGGGSGGGRGGGSYGDLLAILSAYYGVPQETVKHIARDLAAQGAQHG